jgi:pyridoxine 4-dehydrogenase
MTKTTFALGGDIEVRRLGFEAMRITGPGTWGPPRDRVAARALLRRAVELGVQLVDTADAYGPGVSEELIAEALFPYDGILIATKGGYERTGPSGESATGELIGWTPNGHPDHLRSACEASLRRLRVERIDLYQLHTPDPSVPYAESIGALNALRSEGKVWHIGASNVTPEQLAVARTITGIATVQNRLNLANSDWHNMLIECESNEIGFIPYPLRGVEGPDTRTGPDGSRLPAQRKHQSDRPRLVTRSLSRHTAHPRDSNPRAPRRQPCCGVASTRTRRDTCDHRHRIEGDVAGHSGRRASTS